jgi:hypothetical protein
MTVDHQIDAAGFDLAALLARIVNAKEAASAETGGGDATSSGKSDTPTADSDSFAGSASREVLIYLKIV